MPETPLPHVPPLSILPLSSSPFLFPSPPSASFPHLPPPFHPPLHLALLHVPVSCHPPPPPPCPLFLLIALRLTDTGNSCKHQGYAEFNPDSWPGSCAPNKADWINEVVGQCGDGPAYPEEFWNCADIEISAGEKRRGIYQTLVTLHDTPVVYNTLVIVRT